MKVSILFAAALIITASCGASGTKLDPGEKKPTTAKNAGEKIPDDEGTLEKLDDITEYHALLKDYKGIPAQRFDPSWECVNVFSADNILELHTKLLTSGFLLSCAKDFDSDGIDETVITGTYKDAAGKEGSFVAVLSGTNEVILAHTLNEIPRLVHLRDLGKEVLFGSGFGSEYREKIEYKDGKIQATIAEL